MTSLKLLALLPGFQKECSSLPKKICIRSLVRCTYMKSLIKKQLNESLIQWTSMAQLSFFILELIVTTLCWTKLKNGIRQNTPQRKFQKSLLSEQDQRLMRECINLKRTIYFQLILLYFQTRETIA